MNESLLRSALIYGVVVALAVSTPFAAAQPLREGLTAQDRPYTAGGIGLGESEQMKSMAGKMPLSITVTAKSGAYLADSHITIQDARGKVVLDTQPDAPYLLVDLTPGKYNVEATLHGKKQQRSVNIAADTHARIVFSFDVPVDRAPEEAPNKQ